MNRLFTLLVIVTSAQTAIAGDLSDDFTNLDHDSYEQRELAVAHLAKAGEAALPALLEVVKTGSEESKWRAYSAIRQIVGDDAKLLNKTIAQAKEESLQWLAMSLAPAPTLDQPSHYYPTLDFSGLGLKPMSVSSYATEEIVSGLVRVIDVESIVGPVVLTPDAPAETGHKVDIEDAVRTKFEEATETVWEITPLDSREAR